jgi:outer membrane protein OmpA-like peptidoglycan-associated protein
MSIFLRWGIPAFVTVVGGTAAALATSGATIPGDLATRTSAILAQPADGWATVNFDMRDATITGTAASDAAVADLVARVAAVHGVRSVTASALVAEHVSPFPLVATVQNGVLSLSGGYPDEAAHDALLAGLDPQPIDQTRPMSGAPAREQWLAAARYALTVAGAMDEGEVALSDLDITVSGRARSSEAYDELSDLMAEGPPDGVSLAYHEVQPALQSPFEWHAEFDGRTLNLSGAVPSETVATQLAALAPAGAQLSTSFVLASGAPPQFEESAQRLIENLVKLERGTATISDETSSLMGTPRDPAVVESVLLAMAPTSAVIDLDPPNVAEYWFSASVADGTITLDGFVPDAAFRDRLSAQVGINADSLEFGRGAPERFGSGVDLVISALRRMSEGEAQIKGNVVTIEGRAATLADYAALTETLELGAPQGLLLASAAVKPPMATPFTFAAAKAGDGKFALSGYVPSDQAQQRLVAALPEVPVDSTIIADGYPADFEASAIKALSVLALLDTGSVTYDGAAWTLSGAVDTPHEAFIAESAFADAGLRAAGWTYSVELPEAAPVAQLPVVEPYSWRAQKTAGGTLALTGFVPTEPLKRYLANRAGASAVDSTALGAGAPEGFVGSSVAGLDALLALDEGTISLSGDDWTLTGKVATTAQRYTLEAALRAAAPVDDWSISIQAADAAPVVSPFTWSATKGEDGRIAFAGYVPTEALRGALVAAAGTGASDQTLVGSGEPGDFETRANSALEALGKLVSGKASFDGATWSLEGQPSSASDAASVQDLLRAGQWTLALAEPLAVEPAAEPTTAEVPAETEPAPAAVDVPATVAAVEPAAPTPPPVERDYVFSASKVLGGPVEFSGIVPAEPMLRYLAVITGGEPSPNLTVGEGLPTTFIPSAEAGSRALARLADGEFGLDGDTWVLTGRAETEVQREAALADIAGAPGIAQWQTDITLLPPFEVCRDKVGAFATRNAILFESGSARIADASQAAVDELAGYLALCPETSVEVEGHTDSDGEDDANLALSVARAESVVDALILRGVGPERLYAVGYGESLPVDSNETRAGKQANRRIGFNLSNQ